MDEVLFGYSYDYVGDLAETIALVWPAQAERRRRCRASPRWWRRCTPPRGCEGPRLVERWLDRLDASGRYALLKLVTGALRVGVTARLAKQALARLGGKDVTEIEEIWHGLAPPYVEFFAWLEGRAERPVSAALAPFRPVMLAHALDEAEFAKLDPADYAAEWKWDGIRVQAVEREGRAKALFAHRRRHLRRLSRHPRAPRFRGRDRRRAAGRRARRRARSPSRPSATCSSG